MTALQQEQVSAARLKLCCSWGCGGDNVAQTFLERRYTENSKSIKKPYLCLEAGRKKRFGASSVVG